MSKKVVKEVVTCIDCVMGVYGEHLKCKRTGKQVDENDTCKHAKSAFNEDDSGSVRSKRIKTEKNM